MARRFHQFTPETDLYRSSSFQSYALADLNNVQCKICGRRENDSSHNPEQLYLNKTSNQENICDECGLGENIPGTPNHTSTCSVAQV